MRNAAFVFSWLFVIIHGILLVSIVIFCLSCILSGNGQKVLAGTFVMFVLPLVVSGTVHYLATRLIVHRPVPGGLVELVPAALLFIMAAFTGSIVFFTLGMPHLLVGITSILSFDEKLEDTVSAN